MHARKVWFHPASIVVAAACFTAFGAQAAESTFPQSSESSPALTPAQPQAAAPGAGSEKFRQLRMRCETDVPSGKASGDICDEAAALLVGEELPDEFREMREDQRVKIALRLLERGVDSSNRARGRAYDWYNRVGFMGLSAFADPYRAKELMEMMEKSGYPGGVLRKIRATTSILSLTTSEAEKREGCATAKKLLSGGKLDADSARIATEVVATGICTGYEPPK